MITTIPSYIKLSTQSNGQMAFGHIDDDKTSQNVNSFIAENFEQPSPIGFIRVAYSNRSYDDIQTASADKLPNELTAKTGIFTDALITTDSNVVLALPVADCIAMVILDPDKKVLALAHLGWQATADNLTKKLINQIQTDHGCDQNNLIAYLSPHIRKESYHFPAPISQQLNPEWDEFLETDKDGEIHIDITGFNLAALSSAGVPKGNIIVAQEDTANPKTQFNSNFAHNKGGMPGTAHRFLVATQLPEL